MARPSASNLITTAPGMVRHLATYARPCGCHEPELHRFFLTEEGTVQVYAWHPMNHEVGEIGMACTPRSKDSARTWARELLDGELHTSYGIGSMASPRRCRMVKARRVA